MVDHIGREIVEIVEIRQPFCANTYGTSPCTASGSADEKCYHTPATCPVQNDYRFRPEGGLGSSDRNYSQGDTLTVGDFTTTADVLFAVDVIFPTTSSDGVIFEIGGASFGTYLGVVSGNIVARAGTGGVAPTTTIARVSFADTAYLGRAYTILVSVDISAQTLDCYFYDKQARELTLVASDTSAASFTNWAGGDDGGVGQQGGSGIVAGESAATWAGEIEELRVYDSTYYTPAASQDYYLSLFFTKPYVGSREISGLPYAIPSLSSVSTIPTQINFATSDQDAQGLGHRTQCTITFQDHPHDDYLVDPYRAGRSWDPEERGTFWTKWKARNIYKNKIPVRIYTGYTGEALSAMSYREFIITDISGPTSDGEVTITGTDILAVLEARKAQVPAASPGVLFVDLAAAVTDGLVVAGATTADYPNSGTVRINDEIIIYTEKTVSGDQIFLQGLTRGSDETEAADHSFDDTVQLCKRYTNATPFDVVVDILYREIGVPYNWLDVANIEAEFDDFYSFFKINTVISEPEDAYKLLSDMQQQLLFYLWWHDKERLIKLRTVRGINDTAIAITDETNILAGSFYAYEAARERVSQVWVYNTPKTGASKLSQADDFKQNYVTANLASETEEKHGQPSVKKMFSRWLGINATISTISNRVLTNSVNPPIYAEFMLDLKDKESIWTGDNVTISHYNLVDAFGARLVENWIIISAEDDLENSAVKYKAINIEAFGAISYIMAAAAADYPPVVGTKYGYIGNSAGLLSDGTTCGKIS